MKPMLMAAGFVVALQLFAAEPRPAIAPGATREEVIAAMGRPAGESRLGTREILNYPQGQVSLESGRVVRLDFPKKGSVPTPRSPAASTAASPADRRLAEVEAVAREAARRKVPILASDIGAPTPEVAGTKAPDPSSTSEVKHLSPGELKSGLRSTRALVVSATVGGVALAALVCWLLWRTRAKPRPYQGQVLAARISAAASGIPTLPEISAWPKPQLCVMAAVLAESEGYEVAMRPGGNDRDLMLTRRGELEPSVVVCCSPGRAGPVTAQNMRELLGTITTDRVQSGWFVSPAGFSNDARAYAVQHRLLLIDGAHLLARLRELPPILLPKLQTNAPW